MAAIFYSSTGPSTANIFKSGLQINTAVSIPFLNNLIGAAGYCAVSNVSINNQDTVQFFQTFDDFISYFYFGKALGDLVINGILVTDGDGNVPGLNAFYDKISNIRGERVLISFGNVVFTCVLVGFSTTAITEPADITDFTLQLKIIDHSLGKRPFVPRCV